MGDIEHQIDARWKKLNGDSRKYPTRNEKCFSALNSRSVAGSPQSGFVLLAVRSAVPPQASLRTLDPRERARMMS
jgi:hypothetical protein